MCVPPLKEWEGLNSSLALEWGWTQRRPDCKDIQRGIAGAEIDDSFGEEQNDPSDDRNVEKDCSYSTLKLKKKISRDGFFRTVRQSTETKQASPTL